MDSRWANTGVTPVPNGTTDPPVGSVSIVLLPASAAIPPQELAVPLEDPIPDLLGPYFGLQPGETVDIERVVRQARDDYHCTSYVCPHVSPEVLRRAAEAGTLQRLVLSSSASSTTDADTNEGDHHHHSSDGTDALAATTKLYLYYDESAGFKGRAENARANACLAHNRGSRTDDTNATTGEVLCGDVFLVRTMAAADRTTPVSLRLADLGGLLG